jgi:hypothetical protein
VKREKKRKRGEKERQQIKRDRRPERKKINSR